MVSYLHHSSLMLHQSVFIGWYSFILLHKFLTLRLFKLNTTPKNYILNGSILAQDCYKLVMRGDFFKFQTVMVGTIPSS